MASVSAPSISIVIPLHNKEKEVGRAIASVLSQTFGDFEVIVVNDGSTDRSRDVVQDYEDPRIRIIDQSNQGVSAARNRGIAEARSGLIAFLDADDEWEKDYLETILKLAEKYPDASVFATGYMIQTPGGIRRRAVIKGLPAGFSEGILKKYFAVASYSDPPLWTSAVAVRKEAIKAVGGFPEGVIAGEDLLTWARLAIRFNIAYSSSPRAVFYAPARMEDRPPRSPQVPDRVAEGLRSLLDQPSLDAGAREAVRQYVGLWHRMRAVVFLKLNRGLQAREEIRNSANYTGMTLRLAVLLMLSWLPGRLPESTYSALMAMTGRIRNSR